MGSPRSSEPATPRSGYTPDNSSPSTAPRASSPGRFTARESAGYRFQCGLARTTLSLRSNHDWYYTWHSEQLGLVPVQEVRQDTEKQRSHRIDGPRRCLRRQRRHGIVLLAAAEQRPRPPPLDHPRKTAPGHRYVDREDLPPPP